MNTMRNAAKFFFGIADGQHCKVWYFIRQYQMPI